MENKKLWERQIVRAGPLVKELRRTMVRIAAADDAELREGKLWFRRQTSLNRGLADRVELRLALMGTDAIHYVLTFDDQHLPESYHDVARYVSQFIRRCRRHRQRLGMAAAYDYIRCIEGLHGDHRWHLHFVCKSSDFDFDTICALWRGGSISAAPAFHSGKGFWPLARYLTKERADGFFKPLEVYSLTASSTLAVPPVQLSTVRSGRIVIPGGAQVLEGPTGYSSPYGSYQRAKYLVRDTY